jgi:coenzyme F420-reducing hydrogenase alpha subunit
LRRLFLFQLKAARAQVAQSSATAVEAEKKVERAIDLVSKTSSKKCGCKSKCPPQCGCRKEGLGCRDDCGCDLDQCQNPHSYTDDDEGRAKWTQAISAGGRRALKKKQGAAEEAKKAAMLAKIEAGQMDQQF